MKDKLIITQLDQLRALSDPLRLRVVEALIERELSVTRLAAQVRVPASRLYHHVDLLLDSGLIEVTRRVPRRGTEERWLRAAARDYTLDGSLFTMGPGRDRSLEALLEMSGSVFDTVTNELGDAIRRGVIDPARPARRVVLESRPLELGDEAYTALTRELPAWIDQFARRHRSGRPPRHRLVVVLYPTARPTARARS